MRGRGILFTSSGAPRLLMPGVVGVLAAFIVTLSFITFTGRKATESERADILLRSGKPAQAERLYVKLLRDAPTVPLVLSLFEAHHQAQLFAKLKQLTDAKDEGSRMGLPEMDPPLAESELDALLAQFPPDVATVAAFARGLPSHMIPDEARAAVTEGAGREPPLPWSNHLLALEAQHESKHSDAAGFFEREGIAFPDRSNDVDTALQIWEALEAWDTLRDRLADPRVYAAASPHFKYKLAVHDGNWRLAARWLPFVWAPRFGTTGLAMSLVTALGWAFFCARLGKLGSRVRFRLPMYAAAFALGIASVVPTVLLIAVEEAKLRLVETGDPARDVIFFVFGVGLREEAAKILLFLPLLPILRKWGDKLDVLVCGAMVGLGFAAEENLNYLANDNLHVGLGRFLTANFFHMALTGTLASALDDFVANPEKNASDFMRASLFVVGLHGAYDFLLSHEEYGGSYLAMSAFVFLTKLFLDAVDTARRRSDRGITPLHAFILAVAVVTGASLAYATTAVGPRAAFMVMGAGLLGEAIIVYVFVRQLRALA